MDHPVVLIADNSPTCRTLIRQEIDPDRFEIHEASDGEEAIRLALENRPTIITVSKELPTCDGIEVCKTLTADESLAHTKIIMITSSDAESERARAFAAGAVRFLPKGFSRGELTLYIDEIMRTRGQLAQTRVLVVEDSGIIRTMISRLLQAEGAVVYTAANGVEALETLDQHKVDVVLTDYHMPRMDGIMLVEAIREKYDAALMPVLFISASDNFDTAVRALDTGANDFIRKPFEATELLARIRSFVRLSQMATKLESMATTDELTSLYNRRHAMERLCELSAAAERCETEFSCIMLDLDHFKRINDSFGHAAGDMCLKRVASIIRKNIRTEDLACRIGGEEFLIICPHVDSQGAALCAEKLRQAIKQRSFTFQRDRIGVTVSAGVAAYQRGSAQTDAILRAADAALYAAKDSGRDTVRVSGQDLLTAASN